MLHIGKVCSTTSWQLRDACQRCLWKSRISINIMRWKTVRFLWILKKGMFSILVSSCLLAIPHCSGIKFCISIDHQFKYLKTPSVKFWDFVILYRSVSIYYSFHNCVCSLNPRITFLRHANWVLLLSCDSASTACMPMLPDVSLSLSCVLRLELNSLLWSTPYIC